LPKTSDSRACPQRPAVVEHVFDGMPSPSGRRGVSKVRRPREIECEQCGATFAAKQLVDGVVRYLYDRRACLECLPLPPYSKRHQRRPRLPRPISLKACDWCGRSFQGRQVIDGKLRYLYNRRFCLDCSLFGAHNTSKHAPPSDPDARKAHRAQRRTESFLRYQRKRRRRRKSELIEARRGRCEECGYSSCTSALEFHHRDPGTKEFGVGGFSGSTARLLIEAEKCDLLCANCHRLRHTVPDSTREGDPVVLLRRDKKARAIAYMGRVCFGCGRDVPSTLFEFHHWDASEKDFGISEDGIVRRWEKVIAELAKCVMLCANCHREVHAGVRQLDEGLLGLAETAGSYAA